MDPERAYRLNAGEPLSEGIVLIAQGRIDHAIAELGGKSDSVDRLAASALYLPTHYGVSDDYARAVAAALAEHLT